MMISNRVRAAGATLAIGLVGAVFYLGSAGQGFTPGVTMPMGCSGGDSPQFDGAAWQCRTPNDYRSTHFHYCEEFLNTATDQSFGASSNGTGAGGVLLASAGGTGARPGILDLSTGTTATGAASRRTGLSIYPADWTKVVYEASGCTPALSSSSQEYSVVLGCYSTDRSATQSDGAWLAYDRGNALTGGINTGNASKWEAFTATASSRTRVLLNGVSQDGTTGGAGSIATVDSAVAACTLPNAGFHTYRVTVNGTTNAKFEIDNVTVATLPTNLPASGTALQCGIFNLKSVGTTTADWYLDRHCIDIDVPAARLP